MQAVSDATVIYSPLDISHTLFLFGFEEQRAIPRAELTTDVHLLVSAVLYLTIAPSQCLRITA